MWINNDVICHGLVDHFNTMSSWISWFVWVAKDQSTRDGYQQPHLWVTIVLSFLKGVGYDFGHYLVENGNNIIKQYQNVMHWCRRVIGVSIHFSKEYSPFLFLFRFYLNAVWRFLKPKICYYLVIFISIFSSSSKTKRSIHVVLIWFDSTFKNKYSGP